MGLAAVNVVWVFLSGSRGGLLIAGAALLFVLMSLRGTAKKVIYVGCAALVATVVSGWFADSRAWP